MDDIAHAYLSLALALDRHMAGLVDAYYGPPELKAAALAGEPRPLDTLADDAGQLLSAIEAGDLDAQRRDFLWRQTRALAAIIRNLSGDRLDFVDEVEQYFDITPPWVPEETFEAAHAEMERLLPGPGPLLERMVAWRKTLELAPDRIMPVFDLARRETRRRTLALFPLPEDEDMELHLVRNQPWSAYNWYLGDYRSRIELNTDLPTRASAAVPLMAHEAYAGHHTEHAVKEALLVHGQGRAEHSVQLLLAPECVLSEGLADSARDILFTGDELAAFLHDELYPLGGLSHIDVDLQLGLEHAADQLKGLSGNAAMLLHRDGRPAAEVQRYLEHYGLRTSQEGAKSLSFISDPLFRSYIYNYSVGEALLRPLLTGAGRVSNFRRLLSEPLTPTQVREWLAATVK